MLALLLCTGILSGLTAVSAEGSVLDDNTLTVAMECAYAPYNWTQPDSSNGAVPIKDSADYANGYDVMMAKKIADALGMELEIVRLDWDSLVPAVQSGTVDCVIAGQSITSERLESVDFTAPYFYASIVGLTRTDSPYAQAQGLSELAGATATSQLGHYLVRRLPAPDSGRHHPHPAGIRPRHADGAGDRPGKLWWSPTFPPPRRP